MHIFPEYHRAEYHQGRTPTGRSAGFGPIVSVELTDEEPTVCLVLDPLYAETFEDRDVCRTFSADEARDLAAMLWHKADMADRRAGLR